MRATAGYAPARRRALRAPQLVNTTHAPVDADNLEGWQAGLVALRALEEVFPDFFATHVAALPLTPSVLYGSACALLRLTHETLFPVEDPPTLWNAWSGDPSALPSAAYRDDAWVLLSSLSESRFHLLQPRPVFYGVGVETVWDADEEIDHYDLLTIALWWSAEGTQAARGFDWGVILEFSDWEDLIPTLPTLPEGFNLEVLIADLNARPLSIGVERGTRLAFTGTLLAYAFGETDNDLANVTNHEIAYHYDGEIDVDWSDAHRIAENARAAREIADQYQALAKAMQGERPIKRFMSRLVRRARQLVASGAQLVPATPAAPLALADILADDDAEPTYVTAWLGEGDETYDDDLTF
jgi:hypothetical protein